MKLFVLGSLGALLPSLAFAATITLHNTGVNSSDVLVAAGAATSFWTLSAEPVGASEAIGSNPFRYPQRRLFCRHPDCCLGFTGIHRKRRSGR